MAADTSCATRVGERSPCSGFAASAIADPLGLRPGQRLHASAILHVAAITGVKWTDREPSVSTSESEPLSGLELDRARTGRPFGRDVGLPLSCTEEAGHQIGRP